MASSNQSRGVAHLLPTAVQWERTCVQQGLLDWAFDEIMLDGPVANSSSIVVWPPWPVGRLMLPSVAATGLGSSDKAATPEGGGHEPVADADEEDEGEGEGSSESNSTPRARGAPLHAHVRGKLTSHHAVAIFLVKLRPKQGPKAAEKLALEFGVTAKAIRDVWARKSWVNHTMPYWELSNFDAMPLTTFGSVSSDARVASALSCH